MKETLSLMIFLFITQKIAAAFGLAMTDRGCFENTELKKQTQFVRIAYWVLWTALWNLKKQSQFTGLWPEIYALGILNTKF